VNRTVPVPAYRSTVDSAGGGLSISIPSRRNYLIIAFLLIWLGGWFMAEFTSVDKLLAVRTHDQAGFIGFWLIAWTAGGAFAVLTLLWNLAGRERVLFSRSEVTLRREIFGVGFGKRYEAGHVKNLRSIEIPAGPFGTSRTDPFGWSSGALAFDYGAKTVRFGNGIDSAEATYLVEKIIAASPWLRRSTDSSS
jgi:hypothetical protein